MDSPRGAEQRAVVDPHHEPLVARCSATFDLCGFRALSSTANRLRSADFGHFLWRSKKLLAPRPLSALVANQPSPRRTSLAGINLRRAVPAPRFTPDPWFGRHHRTVKRGSRGQARANYRRHGKITPCFALST